MDLKFAGKVRISDEILPDLKRLYHDKDGGVVESPGLKKSQKVVLDKSSLDNSKGRVMSCPGIKETREVVLEKSIIDKAKVGKTEKRVVGLPVDKIQSGVLGSPLKDQTQNVGGSKVTRSGKLYCARILKVCSVDGSGMALFEHLRRPRRTVCN